MTVIAGSMATELARAEVPVPPTRLPVSLTPAADGETVVVEAGDHLWKISESRLDDILRRRPTDAEVSPYWREVIDVNRATLRSGDPDLIYPGEVVVLPPMDG